MPSGGQTTTSQMEIPDWLEAPARRNIGRAEEISNIGYVPNYGPEIAAFNPQQVQAMQNVNSMANAYGMGPGINTMPDLPQATDYGNGMLGYSSTGLFGEAVDQFAQDRPGQYRAIQGQFIDPVTGADAKSQFAQKSQRVDKRGKISTAPMKPKPDYIFSPDDWGK